MLNRTSSDTTDNVDNDRQQQDDELSALESYFSLDGDIFVRGKACTNDGIMIAGEIAIDVELNDTKYPTIIRLITSINNDNSSIKQHISTDQHRILKFVQHLSPVMLRFVLPINYPSTQSPIFTIESDWISFDDSLALSKRLQDMIAQNVGMPIIFQMVQMIKDEAISVDLASNRDIDLDAVAHSYTCKSYEQLRLLQSIRFIRSVDSNNNMFVIAPFTPIDYLSTIKPADRRLRDMIDYDEQYRMRLFNDKWFTCEVCCIDRSGRDCIQFLPCEHIYCNDCTCGYFSLKIIEGSVNRLQCMHDKCTSMANSKQIRRVVSDELFERYERLRMWKTVDTSIDIVSCPRPMCAAPVSINVATSIAPDSDAATTSDDTDPAESSKILAKYYNYLAICNQCNYPFCTLCRKAYHGVNPCQINIADRSKLIADYRDGDEMTRRLLERRYGRQKLRSLIDDLMTEQWINGNSKQCPRCRVPIEKQHGCNKVHCTKCNTMFCWLCMQTLNPSNPYLHFNDPKTFNCFNQLFLGVDDDDDGDFIEFVDDDDD